MQFAAARQPGAADQPDALAGAHIIAFFHRDAAKEGIGRLPAAGVAQHDEVAELARLGAGEQHFSRRRSARRGALRGADITVYGEGSQTRSFCYVDDLVEGFLRLMEQDETVGPVNLGNPGEFTMLELAELILKKVGGKSKIVHRDLPADDPKQRQPDITLAKKYLDWQPTVPLEQGIEKTIDYFRGEI